MLLRKLIARSVFLGTLLVAAAAAHAQSTLAVTFSERSITVSGLTPGGRVAIFGVAREMLDTKPPTPASVVRGEILTDSDSDGTARLDLSVQVPLLGMWAAVDLQNGAHVAFATPGFEPRRMDLVPELLRNDNGGQLRKLEWPFGEIDVFVARPREGAWRFYASKASGADENRDNGNRLLRIDLTSMIAIGDTPPGPRNFRHGDVVAIFDRREFQYGILEVGR